jgi:hypothetical protein
MALFRISYRTDQLGEQFLAVVTCVPTDLTPSSSTSRIESERRLLTDRHLAAEACARMVASMVARITQRGDEVISVDGINMV